MYYYLLSPLVGLAAIALTAVAVAVFVTLVSMFGGVLMRLVGKSDSVTPNDGMEFYSFVIVGLVVIFVVAFGALIISTFIA